MSVIEQKDLFGNVLRMEFTPYHGLDFSKKCFIFPGQSAAHPGMARAHLHTLPILKERFETADQLAKTMGMPKPSVYIDDPESLSVEETTQVRNLALFTLTVGLYETLLSANERPKLITAHSFGEYAAFVASGILSFTDVFSIILERDRLCPEAHKLGSMIAVSANAEQLRNISQINSSWIANINSPEQTVLSVPASNIKETLNILKKNHLAAKVLDSIPQPYHSELMGEVSLGLKKFIDQKGFQFYPPQIPLISSVTSEILDGKNFSNAVAKNILVEQVCKPVHFIKQITNCFEYGTRNFVEVHGSPMMEDWLQSILKGADFKITKPGVLQIQSTAIKTSKKKSHDSKLVSLLNKVVSSVTGYSVEEISLAQNFQEDLGIDSIKKAQIVLNFLESQGGETALQDGVMMNQIRTIEDVLNWYVTPKERSLQTTDVEFNLFQKKWIPQALPERDFSFQSSRMQWISVQHIQKKSDWFRELNNCDGVVIYDEGSDFDFEQWFYHFNLAKDLFESTSTAFLICLAVGIQSRKSIQALSGLLRSISKEFGFDFQSLTFANFNQQEAEFHVQKELASTRLSTVLFSDQRYVLNYEKISLTTQAKPPPNSVFAIGGAAGVTFEILCELAKQGTRQIYIVGRRNESEVANALSTLRGLGAEVYYQSADATNFEQLKNAFAKSQQTNDRVDLVLHGGGYEYSARAHLQTTEQIHRQMNIKVQTVRHLRQLSKEFHFKTVQCFSSTAAEFGNQGQSIYSYANELMAYECQEAQSEGLDFSVLCWPAWDRVGMTEKVEIDQQLRLTGYHLMPRKRGQQIFMESWSYSGHQHLVCMDKTCHFHEPEKWRSRALNAFLPHVKYLQFPVALENWTLKDLPAFKDHLIMGQSLVPVSFALTFLWHLNLFMKGQAVKLQNVLAHSFMVLHRKDSPYLIDHKIKDSIETFDIRTNQSHIEAQVTAVSSLDLKVPPYIEPTVVASVDMKTQAYGIFGEALHLLENVRVTIDDRAYAEVVCSKHRLYQASTSLNRQLVLLEALFHLSGACSDTKTGRISVPLSVESFCVNEEAAKGDVYKLVVQCRYPHTDLVEADLFAYNENGEIYMVVRREKLRLFAEGVRA